MCTFWIINSFIMRCSKKRKCIYIIISCRMLEICEFFFYPPNDLNWQKLNYINIRIAIVYNYYFSIHKIYYYIYTHNDLWRHHEGILINYYNIISENQSFRNFFFVFKKMFNIFYNMYTDVRQSITI